MAGSVHPLGRKLSTVLNISPAGLYAPTSFHRPSIDTPPPHTRAHADLHKHAEHLETQWRMSHNGINSSLRILTLIDWGRGMSIKENNLRSTIGENTELLEVSGLRSG